MLKIYIISIVIFSSLSNIAMENSRDTMRVIKDPVSCAYFGFIAAQESLPPYMNAVVRDIPDLPQNVQWRQTDQFLLNEVLTCEPESSIYCHAQLIRDGQFISGGQICTTSLALCNKYCSAELNYIVCRPTSVISKNGQPFIISMGTKLHLWGETRDDFGVKLPQGASGWISKNDVCELWSLRSLSGAEFREKIVAQARLLLGQPYQWGGRAALAGCGYDCAGLVNIVFATSGKEVARGVSAQYISAKPISFEELLPGDLVFTVIKTNIYKKAVHVMIWVGNNMLIEASPMSMTVREATIEEIYKKPFDEIKHGQEFSSEENQQQVFYVAFGRLGL